MEVGIYSYLLKSLEALARSEVLLPRGCTGRVMGLFRTGNRTLLRLLHASRRCVERVGGSNHTVSLIPYRRNPLKFSVETQRRGTCRFVGRWTPITVTDDNPLRGTHFLECPSVF